MLADEIIAEISRHPQLREALEEMDQLCRDIAVGKSIGASATFTAKLTDGTVPVKITIQVGEDAADEC